MKTIRTGSLPSTTGPDDHFTGRVRLDGAFRAEEPGRVALARSGSNPAPAPPGTRTRPAGR